jgi:hypothetical protein
VGKAIIETKNKRIIEGVFNSDGSGAGEAKLRYCFEESNSYDALYNGEFKKYVKLDGKGLLIIEELGIKYEGEFKKD